MKRIIIVLVAIVVGYVFISNTSLDNGVNVIKNHKAQLEEMMKY